MSQDVVAMLQNRFLSLFQFPGGPISPVRRLIVTSVTVLLALGVYFVIDRWQPAPKVVRMPSWVPFWPVFALPYFSILFVTCLLPVAIRDGARFRACIVAMICAFMLVMPWWIITPTTLPRPPLPEGWWAAPYRWLTAIDPPNNVMPCAHGIGLVIGSWFAGRDRTTWRLPLVGILVLGLPTISLVWQHRPLDIILGTLASAIGIIVGEVLIHLNQPGSKVLVQAEDRVAL